MPDFGYLAFGGRLRAMAWTAPLLLFCTAVVFGGVEEIGWRYTFQPILEERMGYVAATLVVVAAWGVWHGLYFYIDGTLRDVDAAAFALGLLTNSFLLSCVYAVTSSLWLCVMAHALINTMAQTALGGGVVPSVCCKAAVIAVSIAIVRRAPRIPEGVRGGEEYDVPPRCLS